MPVSKTRRKLIENARKRGVKVDMTLELNQLVLENVLHELKVMKITKQADIQNFIRGSIFAGLRNARLGKTREWKKFEKAVQPLAKKHLGMGLRMGTPAEFVDAGKID
jgi:hypothetical protein